MIYNSWTMQLNILMSLSSVQHECWCCIESFLGSLRIFNVKLWPWRVMTHHGGSHHWGYVLYAWHVLRYAHAHFINLRL